MKRIDRFNFEELTGKNLKRALVHYIEPELNILFLVFDDDTILEISGLKGSEVLGATSTDNSRLQGIIDFIFEFEDFRIFYNKSLLQVRILGEAWNGHGLEMSFDKELNKTLIVQSIYSGRLPDGWSDCIRLGVGDYTYTLGNYLPFCNIKIAINVSVKYATHLTTKTSVI